MTTILAATDFSERSERALRRADSLAALMGVRLAIVHVVDDDAPADLVEDRASIAERALGRRRERVDTDDVVVRILRGDPFLAIRDTALELDADLIVAGDHRRSIFRDMFRDTTVERLIRVAGLPVLVARSAQAEPYRHALVGIEAEEPAPFLSALARLGPAAPTRTSLLHAFDPIAAGMMESAGSARERTGSHRSDAAERLRRRIDALRSEAERNATALILVEDDPAPALEAAAARLPADLIVTSTHARRGFGKIVLGSVTSELLRGGKTDLLILSPAV